MKKVIQFVAHFISSIFLAVCIGLTFSMLLSQSKFLDMRFDVSYFITAAVFWGLLSYYVRVFMNGKNWALWEKKILSGILIGLSFIIVLGLGFLQGSLSIVPAYYVRRGLFLDGVVTLSGMNMALIVFAIIGLLSVVIAHRMPLEIKKEIKMEWSRMATSSKVGMTVLFAVIALFILLYFGQGEVKSMVDQAISYFSNADVEAFRDYLLSFGPLAAIVSAFLMIFTSIVAPLPAFVITFTNGLLFGWVFGAILSWSSAMLGAIACYYIAKFLGRPVVEKIVTKKALQWWDHFFDRYGSQSIFLARLIPVISFDLVSYAAGTTSITFWRFFWATGLGQLPATLLYSYLGKNATGTVQILFYLFIIVIALAVLGAIFKPIINKKIHEKRIAE